MNETTDRAPSEFKSKEPDPNQLKIEINEFLFERLPDKTELWRLDKMASEILDLILKEYDRLRRTINI